MPVSLGSRDHQRFDFVAEATVDFTAVLGSVGEFGPLDLDSLRCHEVDSDGLLVALDVPFQFDPDSDFDPQNQASGTLVMLAEGITPARSARYFHVYFDVVGTGFVPPVVSPLVQVVDGVFDEGQSSIQVTTGAGEYFYQKDGGGFSSLVDAGGNDWIGYHPTGGSDGAFRGIPNLVYPAGHFHPGAMTSSSQLESAGPLKAKVSSVTNDGLWDVTWEFYPQSVSMTVHAAAGNYWFLYEGTPGGSLDLSTDLFVRSNGVSTPLSMSWDGELPDEEWVYFADPLVGRSLFLAHEEDDLSHDSYHPLDGQMTVFGFGRDGITSLLDQFPAHFTIGLIDDTSFGATSEKIRSFIEPADVVTSPSAVQ